MQALMEAVDKQPWDPSVKALTQFPTVLDQMAKNLAWTSALGDAAFNQQKDVMTAIQKLRQEAKAAGNLKTTKEIKVVQESPQTIVIQPANPQVVYVPTYNPTVVYGTPYNPPGYSTAALVTTGVDLVWRRDGHWRVDEQQLLWLGLLRRRLGLQLAWRKRDVPEQRVRFAQ